MKHPKAVGGLHMQELANETMIYNEADGRAHALNSVAAVVLEHCDGHRSPRELVGVVAAAVDTPVDLDVIDLALNDLEESGLIEANGQTRSVSRRDLIRKMGVGAAAAAALPIVESVITPAAASDLGSGPVKTPYPTQYPTKPPYTYAPTYVPTYPPTYAPTNPPQTTLVPTNPPQTTLVPTSAPQPPQSMPPVGAPTPIPPGPVNP